MLFELLGRVLREDLNVHQVIVLVIQVVVMVLLNVLTYPMKQVVHHVIRIVHIVEQISLLVIIHYVLIKIGFVMAVSFISFCLCNNQQLFMFQIMIVGIIDNEVIEKHIFVFYK
jgi:hypothetical protein